MIDKDAFSIVSELLVPETFYEPRNQKIYEAIRTLNMNENPVDVATVINQLQRNGTLEDVGGPAYLVELSSHVASRSEEHTSELQSRQYLVCRLLLEKKKKTNLIKL